MLCSKCNAENKEGAKFCSECGNKFELKCPKCGSAVSLSAKFCDECGAAVGSATKPGSKELSFDEKLRKIQKYLPGGLTEKILAKKGKIEGELKQVTVLFADMENFTPLVEKIGPEEAYAIMDQVYEILIHKVHEFEGTVNEMTGDGIMALFGAPIALEDAPQRAIRSALAIHQEITKFSDRVKQEKGIPPIRMRIGIHTGPVVVGTLGNDLRVEFKAVGDTVNLASRIQNLAPAGTTYVSEGTFKLTEGFFRFESLGSKEIKGREKPVGIYQVIAPSSSRTRFDVNAERGLTVFVGRTREFGNLIDGLDRAKSGSGQVFSLIGEAGVGKSRLLYEFRKAVTSEDITFLEGKCLSYGRGSAYHPMIDILKAAFNIQTGDSETNITEKIKDGLRALNINSDASLPFLLELLSVKNSGMEMISMSPEGKKDRLIEIIKKLLIKHSELQPLVIAIEDLHWVDKSTEDALKYFLEVIAGSRILVILTHRPEYLHPWDRKSYHNQLTLNRLSNRETLMMAATLLGNAQMDRDIEGLILSRTEGIPFFIEEHIKSLKDLKIIENQNSVYRLSKDIKAISIPSTIQDVIMARVDALPEGAKEIIRIGSVIEREFSYELLEKVTELPERELLSNLSILKDSELLYERGIYPDSTYIFKHALTREVVYDSILTKKKKEIHKGISLAIENLHREEICYHYGKLANHCIACEDFEKGAEYARLEAKRSQKAGLYNEAIDYAQKVINCLEQLPQTEANQKKLIDARTTLSNYYLILNRFYESGKTAAPALDLALALDHQKRLPSIYTAMGSYTLFVEKETQKGLSLVDKATGIAEQVSDYFSWFNALFFSGAYMASISEFEDAHKRLRQCLEFSLVAKNPLAIANAKSVISQCYQLEGKAELGFQFAHETLDIAGFTDDSFIKSFAYAAYGPACYQKGFFEDSKMHLLEWVASYEKLAPFNWMGWANAHMGLIYFDLGEYDRAADCCKKIIAIYKNTNFYPSVINLFQTLLLKAKALKHDHDFELDELFVLYENINTPGWQGWAARNIGEIMLIVDDHHIAEAEAWFQKAIELHSSFGLNWHLSMDHASYSEFFKKKGDIEGVKAHLAKAIDIFKECGADGWVEKYQRELALIS